MARVIFKRRQKFGQPSKPGNINVDVLMQGRFWWDMAGRRHKVATLDREYALNILLFIHERFRGRVMPGQPLVQALRKRVLG